MFKLRFWTHGLGSYALAIGVALTIRWAFMEAYVIPSGSMLPSLLINDHIFVNKSVYGLRFPFSEKWISKFGSPKRGEVIVFKYPENKSIFYIKRVVGVPGDKINYEDDTLYINDEPMKKVPASEPGNFSYVKDVDFQDNGNRPYRTKDDYDHFREDLLGVEHDILLQKGVEEVGSGKGPWEVPPGQLFVMGDNRDNSNDSRAWLYVPEDYVLGRAMFVWLSCEKTLPVLTFLCNPFTIRFTRFFHQIH